MKPREARAHLRSRGETDGAALNPALSLYRVGECGKATCPPSASSLSCLVGRREGIGARGRWKRSGGEDAFCEMSAPINRQLPALKDSQPHTPRPEEARGRLGSVSMRCTEGSQLPSIVCEPLSKPLGAERQFEQTSSCETGLRG